MCVDAITAYLEGSAVEVELEENINQDTNLSATPHTGRLVSTIDYPW